jgi:hypothetical protein
VGIVLGALHFRRFRGAVLGAFAGLLLTLSPYLIFRAYGVFRPYYSQGYFTIECLSTNSFAGSVWWMSYHYGLCDAAICSRFMDPPTGG